MAGPARADVPSDAVAWAQSEVGQSSYQGQCLQFVADAYASAGVSLGSSPSAVAYWNSTGGHHDGDANPPKGALAFWGATSGNPDGHVAISRGDGSVISSEERNHYDIHVFAIGDRQNYPYLGWLIPPGVTPPGGDPVHSKTIITVKKTAQSDGTQQVYSVTSSDVLESWWHDGGDGVHTGDLITIAQNDIRDADKIVLPDGTQSLYTAVSDGVWETWWRSGDGPHSAKIIGGLSGVRKVIAAQSTDGGGHLTHLVYVLAADGPYEYWWRDGGDGIHSSRLSNINDPIAFARTVQADGIYQVYTATAGAVFETAWKPGQTAPQTGVIIGISQNDIQNIDKIIKSDGTNELYTITSAGIWENRWGGSAGAMQQDNLPGGVVVKKFVDSDGTDQLYGATGDHVQQYWWNSGGSGGSTLITISQGGIRAIDVSKNGVFTQLYTAAGKNVWETWRGGDHTPSSSVLVGL